jgi:hypothetical protein
VSDNRRSSTRHAVSLGAQITVDGVSRPCTVINLSVGGALLAAGVKYAMEQRMTIKFNVPTMAEPIEVGATVRWSDDRATGVQFDGPRAREVWALNKFFEQLPVVS